MGDVSKGRVLIVDDEPTALKVLTAILEVEGFQVLQASGVDRAINILDEEVIDAVITDMKMPGKTGLDLFHHVKRHHPHVPVIFLTAYGTIEAAVNAMANGAHHYFVKPPDFKELKRVLVGAVAQGRLQREAKLLRDRRDDEYKSLSLLGDSPAMKCIYDIIQTIKDSSCSVLICGETGTGKELIARALHFSGNRSHRPFVAVNCAAIPHELIEAELFGHEKGAFTGASQRRIGRVEAASGGTLFLDEIGELDISVQSKLLRVLQEKEFNRLGDNSAISVDFRVIASTNRNLSEEIENGSFREDLFYRLNVVRINVPPLRRRKEDILSLAKAFLEEFCLREGKSLHLKGDVLKALQSYRWPGNVRELKNQIEGLVVLARGRNINVDDLPETLLVSPSSTTDRRSAANLKEVEARTVQTALRQCEGNKSKAAKLLGVSRKTLYKRIREAKL